MRNFILASLLTSSLFGKGPVFVESRGIVAIEAESTSSGKGSWKEKTDVADFSGTSHLEFTELDTLSEEDQQFIRKWAKENEINPEIDKKALRFVPPMEPPL